MISVRAKRKTKGAGLQGILDGLPDAALAGVTRAGKQTHELAVKLSRGRVADSIQIEIVKNGEPLARVFTTSPFAAFLEYGTGIYMDENPLGHIPGSAGARGVPWYVHEDMADLSRYNFPRVYSENGMFYEIIGTHPHPYMRPAAMEGREKSVQAVVEEINHLIKGAC